MIFGQFSTMRQKKEKNSILGAMIRCIMQTEFLINTGVNAHISIIDIFVCYVVTEKILSNLFSQGIISNISWYDNVTRVTKMWIFLHIEINP